MQCFSNACKLKGVHFMTKIGKRIIIIAIPVAVSAVLLLSSVFSAAKFNTFNCFSSFPAFLNFSPLNSASFPETTAIHGCTRPLHRV